MWVGDLDGHQEGKGGQNGVKERATSHVLPMSFSLQLLAALPNASVGLYLASSPFLPMRVASASLFHQQAGVSAGDAAGAREMIGKGAGG